MAISITNTKASRRNRQRLNSEINVTPFVDVMLVLLIIFMVTSPMLVSGVDVDLPSNEATPLSGQDEPIAVTIDKKGVLYLQEKPVLTSELSAKLNAIIGEKKDTRIFIRGDRNINYGRIMEIFSALRTAGFCNVSLVTAAPTSNSKVK